MEHYTVSLDTKHASIEDYSIDSNWKDEDEEAMKLIVDLLISDSPTNVNEEIHFLPSDVVSSKAPAE